MRVFLKALVCFITINSFAYGLEAQVYAPVSTGCIQAASNQTCGAYTYQSGLICIELSSINCNTLNLRVKTTNGQNFTTNGTLYLFDGDVCSTPIATANYSSTSNSRTITTTMNFPIGTSKNYKVTALPSNTTSPKMWAGNFVMQSQATYNYPLLSLPANNQSLAANTTSTTLTWTANNLQSNLQYLVTVKDETTGLFLLNNFSTYITSKSVSGLQNGHSYSWFVKVTNCGYTTQSATRYFSVGTSSSTGNIQVSISPSAISSTAKWRIDGGTWQNSGASVSTSIGNHTIDFLPVTGYTTPLSFTATVTAGNTSVFSVVYSSNATVCGTVKIFVPRPPVNGVYADNIARSAIIRWEHELGRGITYYTVAFQTPTGTPVPIGGQNLNTVTVPNPVKAELSFTVTNSVDLAFNTQYAVIIRGYNANNQEVVNNVAVNFRFTTMMQPTTQAGCPEGTGGKFNIIPYNTSLGHYDNCVVHKNGELSQGTTLVNNVYPCEFQAPFITTTVNPNNLVVENTYGRQCVEFIRRYAAIRYGILLQNRNAKDYFLQQEATLRSIKEFTSGIDTILPQAGDIICFGGSTTYPFGHIGIIRSVNYATKNIIMANQNLGNYSTNAITIDKHVFYSNTSFNYSVNSNSGAITLPSFGTSVAQGILRSEPRMFVELGGTKIATGNNNIQAFTGQPTFKIEPHKGIPVFSLSMVRLNTATNCYDVSVAELSNLPNNGNPISGIPTLPVGKYKARITCTTNGVQSRPVYFEVITAFGGSNDRSIAYSDTELRDEQVLLQPNPTTAEVQLEILTLQITNARLTIYDIQGKLMESKNLANDELKYQWNTTTWSNGVYLCLVQTAHNTVIKKLVVRH